MAQTKLLYEKSECSYKATNAVGTLAMVRIAGFEPASQQAIDFKSIVYAVPPYPRPHSIAHFCRLRKGLKGASGLQFADIGVEKIPQLLRS